MQFGVIYLLTGAQHAARLVVSVYSLRKHYRGPITVFTTRPESHDIGRMIAEDDRLGIELARFDESQGGSNSTYLTKPRLMPATPYDATLFLDADTLVVGDVSELIEATQKHRLVVTGFCDWKTTGISVQKRLEMWIPLAGTPGDEFGLQELIDTSSLPLPAVNAGVLGFHRDSPIMDEWQRLTEFGRDTFLPDEVALQLLLPRYQHFLLGSQFNCSPAFGPYVRDVRIWHFVARSHLGHYESQELWKPAYDECFQADVAKMRTWSRLDRVTGDPEKERAARWPRQD